MASRTIAYSTDGDYWKTRYSFLPSCYGYVDNLMISCANGAAGQAYLHTKDAPKCNYYGTQSVVTLTVASNQAPSRNKFFKNLSLETDLPRWDGQFVTFTDSNVISESQITYIEGTSFISKEGARYTDIPRQSGLGSTANIVYLGERKSVSGMGTPKTLQFKSKLSNAATALTDVGVIVGWDATENRYVCIEDGIVKDYNPTSLTNPVNIDYVFSDDTVVVGGVDGGQLASDDRFQSLFIAYPSEIDGDYMRGRVGVLTLQSLSDVSAGFELHAINVDYEYSGLDT